MELSIRLVTRPWPEIRARILVLIIVIVAVVVLWLAGYAPGTAIPLVLCAGFGSARVARALAGDVNRIRLPR